MTATTPHLANEDMLGPLASRYVQVGDLPWKPTPCAGIDMKVLVEDKSTFDKDEKQRTANLTDAGSETVEEMLRTEGMLEARAGVIAGNIERVARGEPPQNLIAR